MQNFKLLAAESEGLTHLRAMSIILIMACHVCQSYNLGYEYILNIGVQIFFVISGLLHGLKNINGSISWYKHKFSKVFIPYYTYIIIILPIYALIWPQNISAKNAIGYVLDVQMFMGGGQLWFMTAIAICYIITPILQLLKSKAKIVSILLLAIALIEYNLLHKQEFLFSAVFLYTFGFFVINTSHKMQVYIAALSLFLGVGVLLHPSVDLSTLITPGANSISRIFHDFTSIAIVLITLFVFRVFNISATSSVVKLISQYSFPIYLTHGLYLTSSPVSNFRYVESPLIAILVFLCCTIISALCLDKLTKKISNHIMLYQHSNRDIAEVKE